MELTLAPVVQVYFLISILYTIVLYLCYGLLDRTEENTQENESEVIL